MAPEPNVPWSLKKKVADVIALWNFLFGYYVHEGRTLKDCLDSLFLKHESQFQRNLELGS